MPRGATARLPPPAGWASAFEGIVPDRVLFSPWVKRIARVGFLGALAQAPGCRSTPSRLDHSAGVAALALQAARDLRLAEVDRRVLVTAALLHDVGHFPLSHTAETAFRARWGVDHHGLSRWIVLGGGPIPRERSLAGALAEAGLDPDRVWSVISGEPRGSSVAATDTDAVLHALLAAPVNVDTLDGIPLAARAFGRRVARLPASPFTIAGDGLALRRDAVAAIDRFWRLKDRVYRDVINSPAHAALELRLSALVGEALQDEPPADLASFDDAALLSLLGIAPADLAPGGCEAEARFVAASPGPGAPVRVLRHYSVDESVAPGGSGLPLADWSRRWRTSRHRWYLATTLPCLQLLLPGCREIEGDLP